MTAAPEAGGIAVICDHAGRILRVLRDDLGLSPRVPAGAHLADLVDAAVKEKAHHFLEELQTRDAAYDWEITVPVHGQLLPLHFAGGRSADGFFVVAARSRDYLASINGELMEINNEQANALRATAKDLGRTAPRGGEHDGALFDELTKLNNEMANLQREMARKNAQLEKLNAEKNRFLGMAAHDLRSPLGVILVYSEFLEAEAGSVLSDEQREFVTIIKDTSEFMLRLVNDLLDVSTIEAGQLQLDRHPTDLAQLIRRNVTLNGVLAARKQITVELGRPPVLPPMSVDAGKIEQVLNNLISNAVKFSHAGTAVQVRVTATDDFATVAVQDQGQGIPAADLPKLFKPFGKTSVRGTAGEQTTGLGLAIVRRIVEGHGGRIWVDSEVGKGSTFLFTVPVRVDALQPDALQA